MISKARIRLIHALEMRKHRLREGLFVAEGPRLVGEMLQSVSPVYLAATAEWFAANSHLVSGKLETNEVSETELCQASLLRTPQQVLALFPLPQYVLDASLPQHQLCLALDGVQDPGNMGTIVRIADWFGISDIICSYETVDVFNPKAVQATMGALARVRVHYTDLSSYILQSGAPVWGTLLDGQDIYSQPLGCHGIIVMGNEGNGISPEIRSLVTHRLLIPSWPPDRPTTDSLNVAIATSIVCAEFRRRQQ
ncbi:MAG: RNA methyltransferase [Bacteroidaceae bacterium]